MENPRNIKISDFDYVLPDEKIAKFPLSKRDESNLLVYQKGEISTKKFYDVVDFISPNELVVFNNTKVIQARLNFKKETGANIEIFCLEPFLPNDYAIAFQETKKCSWICMIGNLRRWKADSLMKEFFVDGKSIILTATKQKSIGNNYLVDFEWTDSKFTFADVLEFFGELPIPPYLNRATQDSDKQTYQTVYSKIKGSVAAPTAGLHFTESVLSRLKQKKVDLGEVTLHVGAGTFKPVKNEMIVDHDMHTEHIVLSKRFLSQLIAHNGKAVAVGTTSVRTLESLYFVGCQLAENPNLSKQDLCISQWEPYEKEYSLSVFDALSIVEDFMFRNSLEFLHISTQIMIVPGYQFRVVEKLITNFHQPKSTLLLLVSAFLKGDWMKCYNYALQNNFRFLSYGDSSILMI